MGIVWERKPRVRPRKRLKIVKRHWDAIMIRTVERLDQVRRERKLNISDMAVKIGVPRQSLYTVFRRKRPNLEVILGMAMGLGINPRWLLDGHGAKTISIRDWWEKSEPVQGGGQ